MMSSIRRSIKVQFGVVTGILIVGIVLILSLLAASKAQNTLEEESQQALGQQTKQSYELLENFLDGRHSNIDLWSSDPLVSGIVKNEALRMVMLPSLRARFSEIRTKEIWLEHIFILKGNEIIYDDSDGFEFSSNAAAILGALPENMFSLHDLGEFGKTTPHRVLSLRKVLAQEDAGSPAISMVFLLDLGKIHEALFEKVRIGKRGFIALVSANGEGKLTSLLPKKADDITAKDFLGLTDAAPNLEGVTGKLGTVSLMRQNHPEAKLAVVGVASLQDTREPIENLIRWFAILGLLVSVGGVVVAVFFSERLSHPLECLTAVVKKFAQGDLSVRSDLVSENEVGVLARSFNAMAQDLQVRIADVEFLEGLSNALVRVKNCIDLGQVVTQRLSVFLKSDGVSVVCQLSPLGDSLLPPVGARRFELRRASTHHVHGILDVPHGVIRIGDARMEKLMESVRESLEMAIENICSLEDSLRRVAIEAEMKTAHAVQECLFTGVLPEVAGYEMSGYFTPAAQLGGDWYAIYFDEKLKRIRAYIGDVTGHGVSSALITAGAMAVVHTIEADVRSGLRDMDLEIMLKRLHGVIRDVGRNRLLMTFCICEIELATGVVNFINAGHNAPFIITKEREKSVQYLMAVGNRLGYTNNAGDQPIFKRGSQTLEPGEILVLYTDGFIEARNEEGKEFGLKSLQTMLTKHRDGEMPLASQAAVRALDEFRGTTDLSDDVSLVLIKRAF